MAVFDTQHPWALTFGLLGNVISFMVFLAPVPTFYRIYKKKSTEGFQSLPYLVALFSSMLWLYYALLKKDVVLLLTINAFGCIVETIYIAMYIAYASKDARHLTIKLFLSMNVALFSAILLFSHFVLKGSTRVEVLGWINVAIAVSVFAAPLSIIAQVVRTKSVEFMPLNLSFFLTLSAVMWFAYGMLKHDKCVAIPNILGFLLGFLQMLLYAIYRNGSKKVGEGKKLPEEVKVAVALGTLGNGEQVYPVDADVHPHDDGVVVIDVKEEETKKSREKTEGDVDDEKTKVERSNGLKPNDAVV